ncbi:hypothetical protein GCM10009545_42190 [Saccharopolyspora thermophila]|uniref:Uncharacterized protein n=1 Tax=Saccharopolyspora thermophila TaxID=89367 RepID=A0ABN1D6B4_9PSEU
MRIGVQETPPPLVSSKRTVSGTRVPATDETDGTGRSWHLDGEQRVKSLPGCDKRTHSEVLLDHAVRGARCQESRKIDERSPLGSPVCEAATGNPALRWFRLTAVSVSDGFIKTAPR